MHQLTFAVAADAYLDSTSARDFFLLLKLRQAASKLVFTRRASSKLGTLSHQVISIILAHVFDDNWRLARQRFVATCGMCGCVDPGLNGPPLYDICFLDRDDWSCPEMEQDDDDSSNPNSVNVAVHEACNSFTYGVVLPQGRVRLVFP